MLVLASKSPRRQQILRDAGIPFLVRAGEIAEVRLAVETAEDYVRRLAEEKAFAVPISQGEVILGADTVVVIDEEVLEKPRDSADAAHMLAQLSGREHEVMTGFCLRTESSRIVEVAATRVQFVRLTPEEIASYIESGEPMDKAGAYGIQGLASKFIERIQGCYFNVVGLPIATVYRRLKHVDETLTLL